MTLNILTSVARCGQHFLCTKEVGQEQVTLWPSCVDVQSQPGGVSFNAVVRQTIGLAWVQLLITKRSARSQGLTYRDCDKTLRVSDGIGKTVMHRDAAEHPGTESKL